MPCKSHQEVLSSIGWAVCHDTSVLLTTERVPGLFWTLSYEQETQPSEERGEHEPKCFFSICELGIISEKYVSQNMKYSQVCYLVLFFGNKMINLIFLRVWITFYSFRLTALEDTICDMKEILIQKSKTSLFFKEKIIF